MGTNFYLVLETCEHCGAEERLHIGKSSSGWRFLFEAAAESPTFGNVMTVDKWEATLKFPSARIIDENERPYSRPEFWSMVHRKRALKRHTRQSIVHETDADIAFYPFT